MLLSNCISYPIKLNKNWTDGPIVLSRMLIYHFIASLHSFWQRSKNIDQSSLLVIFIFNEPLFPNLTQMVAVLAVANPLPSLHWVWPLKWPLLSWVHIDKVHGGVELIAEYCYEESGSYCEYGNSGLNGEGVRDGK